MDEFIKWGTLAGAVVAALTGLQSFFWQFLDRRDRIIVKSGTFRPPLFPGQGLFVVNKSKHQVEIHDYGFILKDSKLFSLPSYLEYETNPSETTIEYEGSSKLEPRERFEAYVDLANLETVGVYARTTTQKSTTLGFHQDLNVFQTCLIRMRVWWASWRRP